MFFQEYPDNPDALFEIDDANEHLDVVRQVNALIPDLPFLIIRPPDDEVFQVLFQVDAQIEEWPGKNAPLAEIKRDEQPPHPTVPIDERMDRLELRMNETDLDQGRTPVLRYDERFEICEQFRYFFRGRGDEGCRMQIRASRTDPVLYHADLSRLFPSAACPFEEDAMDLLEDLYGKELVACTF